MIKSYLLLLSILFCTIASYSQDVKEVTMLSIADTIVLKKKGTHIKIVLSVKNNTDSIFYFHNLLKHALSKCESGFYKSNLKFFISNIHGELPCCFIVLLYNPQCKKRKKKSYKLFPNKEIKIKVNINYSLYTLIKNEDYFIKIAYCQGESQILLSNTIILKTNKIEKTCNFVGPFE